MTAPARSRWTIALPAFLGVPTALAEVGGAYYALSGDDDELPPPPPPVYSREEFSRRVMGKFADEVIEAVGSPDATSADDDTRFGHFKERTVDPITQAKDTDVQVAIKDGKVTKYQRLTGARAPAGPVARPLKAASPPCRS